MIDLTIKEAVAIVRGSDITKGKYDERLAAAEMKILECVKKGWKIIPPKSWHTCYIFDSARYKDLQLLCMSKKIQHYFDNNTMSFHAYCDDHKWSTILEGANITGFGSVKIPSDLIELHPENIS